MLEVRIMGGRQWHGGARPIFRGGMTALRHENLHGGTQAACSVACLERLWWIAEQRTVTKSLRKPRRSLRETPIAKEARKEPRLPRKAPRLSMRIWQRLQCGLSGNSVVRAETAQRSFSRETAPMATGSNGRGNPTEPMPQGLFAVSPPIFVCIALMPCCKHRGACVDKAVR